MILDPLLITLDALAAGQGCVVKSLVQTDDGDRTKTSVLRRLMEIGFVPGERLRMVRRGTRGGPLAIKVGQSTFALRPFEAALVSVTPD